MKFFIFLFVLVATNLSAQFYKIHDPGDIPGQQDWFAYRVAVYREYVMIGDVRDNGFSYPDSNYINDTSFVYMYRFNGKEYEMVMKSKYQDDYLGFGRFIHIDGEWAIGGYHYNETSGGDDSWRVAIWRNVDQEWIRQEDIILPIKLWQKQDNSASSLFLKDNQILKMFTIRENYEQVKILIYEFQDENWEISDTFSIDLAYEFAHNYPGPPFVSSKHLFLPQFKSDSIIQNNGVVHCLRKEDGKWIKKEMIIPEVAKANGFFGGYLYINEDYALIGGFRDENGLGYINLYHFDEEKWIFERKFYIEKEDYYYTTYNSGAINGDYIVLSSYKIFNGAPDYYDAALHVFHKENGEWIRQAMIEVDDEENPCAIQLTTADQYENIFAFGSVNAYPYGSEIVGSCSSMAYILHVPALTGLRDTICSSEHYSFHGAELDSTGIYVDTLVSSCGVDSIVTLDLMVVETSQTIISDIICQDEAYGIVDTLLYEAGMHEIVLQNRMGCDSVVIVELEQNEELEFEAEVWPDYGCHTGSIELTVSGTEPFSYDWGQGATASELYALPSGNYGLTITDGFNCSSEFDIEVPREELTESYSIPNAFTPNWDEQNDNFQIYIPEGSTAEVLSVQIFNRWGEKCYAASDNTGWDGNYKHKASSPGVYLYQIDIKTPCGTESHKGNLILIR